MKFFCNDHVLNSNQKTILCGIINVTPDSFSDGGKYNSVDTAVNRAKQLIEDGAGMLDIGGESTRPGSTYVPVEEEIDRVVPVIKAIKNITSIPISVDTWKSDVASESIKSGADIINDITGFLGDKKMANVVASSKAGAILMFNPVIARPNHEGSKIFPTFGENPFSDSELLEFSNMPIHDIMLKFFQKSIDIAENVGVSKNRIMLDPGIGFGLTKKENLNLINNIEVIKQMGYFTFLGVSRKRFIVNMLEDIKMSNFDPHLQDFKDEASSVLTAIASLKGVEVLRIHTMAHHRIASTIADSIRLSKSMEDINFSAYK